MSPGPPESVDPKVYFWPYDIFGYLLPGLVVTVPLVQAHEDVRALFEDRFASDDWFDVAIFVAVPISLDIWWRASPVFVLERVVVQAYGYPTFQFFLPEAEGRWRRGWRWFKSRLLRRVFPGYCHPYSHDFRTALDGSFRRTFGFGIDGGPGGRSFHDLFWTSWLYVAERSPVAFKMGNHMLELYGFSRNTSMSLILIAFLPLVSGLELSASRRTPSPGVARRGLAVRCLGSAFFLYTNYTKLLRRQNDIVFKAFAALTLNGSNEESP